MKNIKNIIFGHYLTVGHFYLISFVMTIAAFVFSAVFLLNDYIKFKSDINQDLKIHNERIEQKLSDSLFYTKLIMSYVGRQISNNDSAKDLNFIKGVLNSYRMPSNGLMSWSVLSWIDQDGYIVASRGLGILKNKINLGHRDYIKFSKEYPETINVGKPVNGAISGIYIIPIGYGVMDTHRKYVGTVVSGMILKNLQSQIEELIDNPDIFFVIIDTRSRDLVTQSVKGNISKSLIDKVLSKEFSEDSNSLSYKNSYYKKLDEYPYIIGTIYNKGVVNSNAQIRFAIYLAVIFLLLSFICLIFYGFHKKLITPVFDLIKFADQIYKGDPSRKTPKFEVKEMNDLAKSLHKIDGIISNDDRLKKK